MQSGERQVSGLSTGGLAALGNAYFRRRYAILFYSLLLTMVAAPLSGALGLQGGLVELFLAANLLAALISIDTQRTRRVFLAVLTVLYAARLATAWLEQPALSATALGSWIIIGLFGAAGALRFAMGASSVDAEHLYAALSAYLLAGIFFGICYWVLEQIKPGTFAPSGDFSRASAMYFSFVTLATLGYGDVVPRGDIARGLAIVEAVGGQLFLAVMVARLVSLYSREAPERRV